MRLFTLSVLLASTVWAAPVGAQALDQRMPPVVSTRRSQPSVGVRAFGAVDLNALAASRSFDAVVGTSKIVGYGGGVDVLNVWKNVLVRAAVSHMSSRGSRAFVFDGQAFSLHIPLKVSMTPVEIGGGWRFARAGSMSRVVPYAGGGVVVLRYLESSDFAESGEDVSQTKAGLAAFGGAEVQVWKGLVAGAEAQYRRVRNVTGAGGVSQDFEETNLGGLTVRVLFGFKH